MYTFVYIVYHVCIRCNVAVHAEQETQKPFLHKLRFLPDDVAFKSPARLNAQVGLNVVIIML